MKVILSTPIHSRICTAFESMSMNDVKENDTSTVHCSKRPRGFSITCDEEANRKTKVSGTIFLNKLREGEENVMRNNVNIDI